MITPLSSNKSWTPLLPLVTPVPKAPELWQPQAVPIPWEHPLGKEPFPNIAPDPPLTHNTFLCYHIKLLLVPEHLQSALQCELQR